MKPWQTLLIVVLAVAGVAAIVYFATRPSGGGSSSSSSSGGGGGALGAGDYIEAIGSGATGLAAGIARLVDDGSGGSSQ